MKLSRLKDSGWKIAECRADRFEGLWRIGILAKIELRDCSFDMGAIGSSEGCSRPLNPQFRIGCLAGVYGVGSYNLRIPCISGWSVRSVAAGFGMEGMRAIEIYRGQNT